MDKDIVDNINKALQDYSSMLHYSYKKIVDDLRYPNIKDDVSLYFKLTNKYPEVITYFRNTAIQYAKGIHRSRIELLKEEKDIVNQRLSNTKRKLDRTIRKYESLYKYKELLISNKPLVFDNRSKTFKKVDNTIKVYKGKGKNKHCIAKYENDYLFECLYLQPELNKLKARIGLLNFKINKLQDRLDYLAGKGYDTKYIPAVQFGTKKLRRQRAKRQEYQLQRSNRFSIQGRGDSVDGNFAVKYDTTTMTLTIKTSDNKKGCIVLQNVSFNYGEKEIKEYYIKQYDIVHNQKKRGLPITYSLEDKGKYYIIKCSLKEEEQILNYSKADGVIGVDTNLGFYSVCETNAEGTPLLMKDMVYEWKGKTTNQIKYNIKQRVKELIDLSITTHKPLVIEQLKFKGKEKVSDYNSNKSKNFNCNMFAYRQMSDYLIESAKSKGVEVYFVKPMYTSFIGKEKFMPYYKRSVHQMAALSIARRTLFNKDENIPARYKNECSSWKELYNKKK